MTTTEFKDPAATQNDESQNTTNSTKKRGTRTDVGLQQQPDPETFYKNLIAFNERRNTPIIRMPKISGEDVDLHKLYLEVISRGGWLKVNIRNEWEDVLSDLDFSSRCVNGIVALKQIYYRYLDKYEKVYFLGEDPDRPDEPDDDDRQSRHKKWSEKSTPIIPMSYNYLQHNVTEQTRISNKMSTDLYKNSEYEKLLLSLMSPLPNEQDFAINVCTLMANESKHTLKIENCPKLLDALIAHAGVFCHSTMRELFEEFYTKNRKHQLQTFWNDLLYKIPQILELSYENSAKSIGSSGLRKVQLDCKETFEDGLNAEFDEEFEIENIDFDRLEFLSLGCGLGTREYVGQRVQQIASIMRNLSFFEENITIMAKNRTFIRFLVMCSNIRWSNLHHMALDILGNIATELDLNDPTTDYLTRCLISTLCEGIESQDRGVIISCLEILNKFSQKDTNEDYLLKSINQNIYNHVCLYLSLNDIMLLLYTLECIYSLSSLGSTPCNAFVQVKGIVDTLVSLITVEAQSYGSDGCILMRVVETVPGNMLPMVAQNIANLQNVALAQLKQPQQSQSHLIKTEVTQKVPTLSQNQVPPIINSPVASQQQQPQQMSPNVNTPKQNIQQLQQQPTTQENEQFAISWLTATLENAPSVTNRIEQQDLYKLYSAALVKNGKRGAVTQTLFPRIVRSIFGTNIGPTMLKTTDSAKGSETNMFFYVNLKLRANPIPLKGLSQVSQIQNQQQPGQQNNQLNQITQQSHINQNVLNKPSTPTATSTQNSVSTLSKTQSSNDLVNNSNKEVGSKHETSAKLPTNSPVSSSPLVLQTPNSSCNTNNVNKNLQNVNANVPSNIVNSSNSCNKSKTFLQPQSSVIIKKEAQKIDQPKNQSQQISKISVVQKTNTVELEDKDFNDGNKNLNNITNNISIINEPVKVVKQNVIVTNNKGSTTSLTKQIIFNKNIKTNQQSCTVQQPHSTNSVISQQQQNQQSQIAQQQPQVQFQQPSQQQLQHLLPEKQQQKQFPQSQQQSISVNSQKLHQNQLLKTQPQSIQQKQQSEVTQHSQPKMIGNVIITQHSGQVVTKTTTIGQTQMTTTTHVPSSAGGSTAIIKSLLANKVTTTANNNNITTSNFTTASTSQIGGSNGNISTTCAVVKETTMSAVNTNNPNYLITQNVNLHQLAQRQSLAKQKEVSNQNLHGTSLHLNNISTPQKLSTTTISALVNNPIIQSTSVKVGQTTIKPINPHSLEKKTTIQVPVESMDSSSWDPMPPLPPLGGSTVRSIIVPASSLSTASEDSCNSIASSALSTSHVLLNDDGENSLISFDGLLIPKSKSNASSILEDDSSKDSNQRGSQFINANKMLVNLLDKKSPDPPALTVGIKRKLIDDSKNRKKQLIITQIEDSETQVTPSKNAANLYAEMAASILEDEDLEDVIPTSKMNIHTNSSPIQTISTVSTQKQQISQQQQTLQNVIQKSQEQQKQIITMPLHRQIIVSPNVSHQQVILSQNPITVQASQQQQQTITTSSLQQGKMKTDSGLQSVPVILQKQIAHGGQQIIQPVLQQQPQTQTQYVLATNPQGQTYLVAQQTHSQPQPTVLLTQSSGQNQQSGPTKTIIILQQQGGPPQAVAQITEQLMGASSGQPKMIMTTPQGQQMFVTQVPRPSMQQIIVNQGGNVLPQNVVLTQSVHPQSSSQPQTTIQQIQQAAQQSQLSPQLHIQQSILNQQNQAQPHIPQLASNGTTLQIQQQTPQQQQASILSQLPQIPATIKLHTPVSNTPVNLKPIQQQNITTKVINKPGTPSISIVAQNQISSQPNTGQSQIIQQIIKPGHKNLNSPLTKVTIQQQQQIIQQTQQNQQQQTIVKSQVITQPQQQSIQKIQTNQIVHKSQINQNQSQTFQQKLQQSNQNQITNSSISQQTQATQMQVPVQQQNIQQQNIQQNIQGQQQNVPIQLQNIQQQNLQQNMQGQQHNMQQQKNQIQQQKPQQSSLQSSTNQHQNIFQQILAQNPSQTQIIQQSSPIQGTNNSIITTHNKSVITNQNSQTKINNLNQQSKLNSNSTQQNNCVSFNQQNGQNQTQQPNSSQSNNNNNSSSTTSRSETSNTTANSSNITSSQNTTLSNAPSPPPPPPIAQKSKSDEDVADIQYLFVCDWRNCPRKKYKSVQEIYKHACQVHCPEGLDPSAEIYCQWGTGPGFCDNIPRKRFSLMTHLLDRHCTLESMKAAVQRRVTMGIQQPTHANPVTIIKSNEARGSTASPALSTSSSGSTPSGAVISAAMHAIKRHSTDFINPKELMDENEGPVTKSIRLTASLILRNLVTYTDKAKRHIRQYEPHLAGVALSNVESSRTISQILFELNN